MKPPATIPASVEAMLVNHDAKVEAQRRGNRKAEAVFAERSGDYVLWFARHLGKLTQAEYIDQRDARLRDQAERLERNGQEPHTIASTIAKKSIFGLTARRIRTILK